MKVDFSIVTGKLILIVVMVFQCIFDFQQKVWLSIVVR